VGRDEPRARTSVGASLVASRPRGAVGSVPTPTASTNDVAFAVVSRGPGGARGWAEGFLAAFPDLVVHVVAEFVTDGDEVVEWLMSGTHRGQFDGLSPSGRRFHVRGVTVLRTPGDPNLPGHQECMILGPGTGYLEFCILRSEAERGTAS
jgi:hypothetical protein